MGKISDAIDQIGYVRVVRELESETRTNRESGEKYQSYYQRAMWCYVADGQEIRVPCSIKHGREPTGGLQLGDYWLHGASFEVGRFGDMEMRRFDRSFIPIPEEFARLVEQDRARSKQAA